MGATRRGITFPGGGDRVAVHTDIERTAATTDAAISEAVEVLEPRLPDLGDFQGRDYLMVVLDADGAMTDLAIDAADGQTAEWVMNRYRRRLGIDNTSKRRELLFAVTDAQDNLTDLTLRASDGRFEDFVIEGLAARIGPILGASTPPARTDALAVWGSSTMAVLHPHLAALATAANMSFHPGAQGGETIEQTSARSGAAPALLSFPGGTIPATATPVPVTSPNMPYWPYLLTYTGTVAAVHGTLRLAGGAYSFQRTTPGVAVAVPAAGVPLHPDAGAAHRQDTTLLQVGKNSLTAGMSGAEVAERTVAMFEHLTPAGARCLVIGHFVNGGTPETSTVRDQIMACNTALAAHFGPAMFLDVHTWVTSDQLWTDTGITPTPADLEAQALGNKPDSVSQDPGHFNDAGNTALAALIAQRLTALGWI